MDRPWNILEQVVEDPTTKMRIEFSSVHSEAIAGGFEAPAHDQILYMRLWTTDRSRVATYAFTRGGQFIRTSSVEHVDPGTTEKLDDGIEHALGTAAAETMIYNEDHPQGLLRPLDENGNVQEAALTESEKINYAKDFAADI